MITNFFKSTVAAKSVPIARADASIPVAKAAAAATIANYTVKIASWNIDGLNEENSRLRAVQACSTLISENPDIIFLQELVRSNFEIFENALMKHGFQCCVVPQQPQQPYFNAIFAKVGKIEVDSTSCENFPSTKMGRHVLAIKSKIEDEQGAKVPMTFVTSHFESCAESKLERLNQLKTVLSMLNASDAPIVFAGDTNLRDTEVKTASKDGWFQNVQDVWEVCGKPKEAKFTWDTLLNDTCKMPGFKPRIRFDRAYFASGLNKKYITSPVESSFKLIGTQAPISMCFASDHFGLLWEQTVGVQKQ